MSDLSAIAKSDPDFYDPQAIEARLNALAGIGDEAPILDQPETPELQDQFLADTTLTYLGSRTTSRGENGQDIDALIEYHRLEVLPNQSRIILHLVFRPDFETAPTIDVNLVDVSGRTRITQCSRFGARIEITLSQRQSSASIICVEALCSTLASNEQPDAPNSPET
ncbi:hypothetical protein [Mariniblastus fucicola]|uniref:Uncharacterized protein n=1 Tax=Mariniblastus fucicola TaxID=980251 RepID=A0A5B9PB34_9BACT|nr:hypothetical protein [Mariniblastus fucicola]QEG23937.1 hypothetical protein MFFC18_38420 [Mariniblastus fucicola]